MRKQSVYYVTIKPRDDSIPERQMTIQTNNRFSAARAGWLYLGHKFAANIEVRNIMRKLIYKTHFEAVERI